MHRQRSVSVLESAPQMDMTLGDRIGLPEPHFLYI